MVGVALVASWFVAVVFTPYLGVVLLPDTLKAETEGRVLHTIDRAHGAVQGVEMGAQIIDFQQRGGVLVHRMPLHS